HVGQVARVRHVDLVQRDQPRPVGQTTVPFELGFDDLDVADRVAAGFDGGAVDDVDQRLASLDVAQELVAQATALTRALDQARNVGDGEPDVAGLDHTEIRHQGGERVVRDLGAG